MKDKLNFLYCFDKNYNYQAFTSMISLLDKVNEKINIYVIHSENNFTDDIPKKILNHNNLSKIESYQFEDYGHNFANLNNVHISLATYYRLFISNYLPKNIKNIIFIDPDIVCIKNPVLEVKNEIKILNNSKHILSAKTEHSDGNINIGVKDKYFNAGFMILNFNKWEEENYQNQLINRLNKINKEIVQWDQDVLNSVVNGNYIELDKKFNFKSASKINKKEREQILFIHYIGSHKPWLTSGTFEKDANAYHENYNKISNSYFHITHKWKTRSIVDLITSVLTLKILRLNKPLKYIYEFIKSIFL